MKPATPLPWQDHSGGRAKGTVGTHYGRFEVPSAQDAAYIAHAANAYPQLVAALRDIVGGASPVDTGRLQAMAAVARDALRELGED